MRNHSYENDFDLHENETACITHFHKKDFALTLVLKQRHKRTRKWPINPVLFIFLKNEQTKLEVTSLPDRRFLISPNVFIVT